MLIKCPYCGPRDSSEFSYQREGGAVRPDPGSSDQAAWNAYVYDRDNIAGEHLEIWQHSGGCRAHVTLTRNTLTHKISDVQLTNIAVIKAQPEAKASSAKRKKASA